jgi:predicted transcriptional regulator
MVWRRLNNTTGDTAMKIEKLVRKLNKAEIEHNINKVKALWFKILKKSLKHKHTERVQ